MVQNTGQAAASPTRRTIAAATTGQPSADPVHPPPVPDSILLEGLTKTFRNGVTAVDDVNLAVQPGQVFGFLGPNGAGKTTTIKMISGLVTPTAGRARINGFDIGRQRSKAVRQIGAVLEGSRNVYWSLSAWQDLLYFGRLKGLRGRDIKPRAEYLLRELGLWQRRGEAVGGFSRGMAQKVAIAAALITDPPVVLLDEPTIGLDVEAARTVKAWIAKLARDGKTVVLTTHQLAVAQELCHRVAVIRDGRIAADLPTEALLNRYAEDRYEIRLAGPAGHLDRQLPAGSEIHPEGDSTRIVLPPTDHAALYELLGRLRCDQVQLRSVEQVRPDLEEVFVRLLREEL